MNIDSNLPDVVKWFKDLVKQFKFANANAINKVAVIVQAYTISELLPNKFTLRARGAPWQKPGTKMGFNIKFANKNNLEATLGSQADWLKLQEEGGTKQVDGHRLAIPQQQNVRPTQTSVIPKEAKPKRVLASADGVTLKTRAGEGIFKREGDKLKLLYMLKGSATIKRRLGFVDAAKAKVEKEFLSVFEKEYSNALKSAK